MSEKNSIQDAAQFLRAGDRERAFDLLSTHLQNAPKSDTAWYLMSFAAEEKAHKLDAVRRALAINPENQLAAERLGLLEGGPGRVSTEGAEGTMSDVRLASEAGPAPARALRESASNGDQSAGAAAIEVSDLRRIYNVRTGVIRRTTKEVLAVDGISFQVRPGELFGLLGPNGAGKTTTVKMLTTLLLPTSGEARVAGFDVVDQPQEVRRRIGFIFGGERGLYWRLSGYDNLRYFASLYHVAPDEAERRIARLLELVGLNGREDEKVEGYSRGMKQRLHVARTLLHEPEILFLDEPTIGLDPVGARQMRDVIRNMQAENKTILLTTHYMFEADALCDRIGVIDEGKIVALDTPEGLKRHVRDLSVIDVEVFGIPTEVVERLRAKPFVDVVSVEDREHKQALKVQTELGSEVVSQVMAELHDVRVGRVQVREPTLEDAYVRLVGDSKGGD